MARKKKKDSKRPPAPSRQVRSDSPAKKPSSRSRLGLLLGIFCVLAIVFVFAGGLSGFVNSMARAALASKRYDAADWWLRVSQPLTRNNSDSEFLRAQSARKQGDLDVMADRLKSAFDKGFDPKRLDREQTLALVSIGQMTSKMEEDLRKWMLEPGADVAEILDAYTNGLTSISRFDEAILLLQLWEDKVPSDPIPNYRRGRIQEHLFNNEAAEKEYRNAIAKDPNHHKAAYCLGRLLLFLRQPKEALESYQACRSGVATAAAEIGMAQCYKDLGEIETARELLKKCVDMDPAELARSYKAVDETPERFVAASDLGCMETENGNFEEAKRLLEMALKANSLDSIARYSYAVALRGMGMTKESEENFERVRVSRAALDQVTTLKEQISRNPTNTEMRLQVGKIVLEHESERSGIYWYKSIFAYDPTNSAAHKALAEYYQSKLGEDPKYKQLMDHHRSFLKASGS